MHPRFDLKTTNIPVLTMLSICDEAELIVRIVLVEQMRSYVRLNLRILIGSLTERSTYTTTIHHCQTEYPSTETLP